MCHFSSCQWGGVPAILNIICMFVRHESEAQSLSPHYNKKVGKHFSIPSVPSPFAPLSSPGWRVCPHLCWDNLLEYPDFPSWICLKEINGHYVAKLIPNRNCHDLVSQLIELTQRETPPKAIPDLIITFQWDMKHKTDKTIWSSKPFCSFSLSQQSWSADIWHAHCSRQSKTWFSKQSLSWKKNLSLKKKRVLKTSEFFLKKTLSFEKNLS